MVVCRRLFPWGSQVDCLQNRHNSQKGASKNGIFPKKAGCKTRWTRYLKNSFKKDWKRSCLIENTHYFCTRNDAQVLINTGKRNKNQAKIYFPKRFKKVCEIRKRMLHLHPAIERRSLKRWREKEENSEKKFSKKKLQKKLARLKKSYYFCTR